jgi:hypothetical protein
MKVTHLMVLACFVGLGASTATAQETQRLAFEIAVDGKVVARPELRVPSGGEGYLELGRKSGEVRITVAPTVKGDQLAIAFDIAAEGGRARPTLVIDRKVPGAIELASSTLGAVRIGVSWIQ